ARWFSMVLHRHARRFRRHSQEARPTHRSAHRARLWSNRHRSLAANAHQQFMNTQIVGLVAETSIHPGAGQSSGIIDLPVAREAATDYPFVPGSSVKGALLGLARQRELNGKEHMTTQDRD